MTNTTTQAVNPFKEVRSIEIWWHVLDEPSEGAIGDWVVTFLDAQGHTISESLCCYTKMYAIEQAKRFATEYDQDIRIFVAKTKSNDQYKIIDQATSGYYKNRYRGTMSPAQLFNGLS